MRNILLKNARKGVDIAAHTAYACFTFVKRARRRLIAIEGLKLSRNRVRYETRNARKEILLLCVIGARSRGHGRLHGETADVCAR